MNEVFQMRKKHTYIIKTSNNITGDLISDDLVFKTIDSNTCEITVDNEVSITKIIEKLNIHLEISGMNEKFPFGPIISPKPGPTLEIEVAAPDIEVIKSNPVNDNNAEITKKITRYI